MKLGSGWPLMLQEVSALRGGESFRSIKSIVKLSIQVRGLKPKDGAIGRKVYGEAAVALPQVFAV